MSVMQFNSKAAGRRRVNAELARISSQYWQHIPMERIGAALALGGLDLVDIDGEPWEGFILGEQGRCVIDTSDPRHSLVLSWYRFDTGRYEVTAYLS